jgi:para-nitrobenzyl esterase
MSAAGALAGCASSPEAPADPLVARTGAGLVRGYRDSNVRVFKGVPYGASTAGERRFKAPAAPEPWSGIRDALEYGPQCPQAAPAASAFAMWRSWQRTNESSEDCLVLNVWTPALRDGGKRPVMVWLHGGGFALFDGSSPAYDGVRLCNRGDVVIVTLNHRLNLFGYMHLRELGADFASNCGQLDLVAALAWVRDNIAEFGGDPGNVTIFGESGGGAKVSTLLGMPAALGLFHRAIVQSGPLLRAFERETATDQARRFLDRLSIPHDQASRLREVPVERLVETFVAVTAGGGLRAPGFGPVVDGATLPRHPFDPDATPLSANVPLIIGSNAHEMTIFNQNPALWSLTWEDLPARAAPFLAGGDGAHILAEFRRLRPGATPSQIYQAIASERFMGQNSKILAERKAAQNAAPVFMYHFAWETPVDNGRWGSAHALEIAFVFDNLARSTSFVGESPPQTLADRMSECWIAFARTGDPANAVVQVWPRYEGATRATMVFGGDTIIVNDPNGAERALLAGLPSMR